MLTNKARQQRAASSIPGKTLLLWVFLNLFHIKAGPELPCALQKHGRSKPGCRHLTLVKALRSDVVGRRDVLAKEKLSDLSEPHFLVAGGNTRSLHAPLRDSLPAGHAPTGLACEEP